jgi:hypothetical protein
LLKDADTSSELAARNQEIGTIGGAFGAGDASLAGSLPTAEVEPLPGGPGAADKLATLAEPTADAATPLDFWASDDQQSFAGNPSAGIDDGAAFHQAAIVTDPHPAVEPHQVHTHPVHSHSVGRMETADEDRGVFGDSWHSALSGSDMGITQDTYVLDHTAAVVGYSVAGIGSAAMALGGSGGHSVSGISGNVSLGTTKGTGWESTYIDTLISGVKLDGGPIHYYLAGQSDKSTFNDAYSAYGVFNVFNWSASDKTAVDQMFQLYENVTGLDFVQATTFDDADIVWWQSNSTFFNAFFGDTGFIGFNEFPDPTDGTILPLFGVFDTTYMHKAPMVQGADGFQTLMH